MSTNDEHEVIDDAGIRLIQHSNPDAALVILFGWAGCNDRYLKKYAKIYEKK